MGAFTMKRQERRRLERNGERLMDLGYFDVKDGKVNVGDVIHKLMDVYIEGQISKEDLVEKITSIAPERKDILKYVDMINPYNKTHPHPIPFECSLCGETTFMPIRPFKNLIFTCIYCDKTMIIEEIVHETKVVGGKIFFLARPITKEELEYWRSIGQTYFVTADKELRR
jgi:hypothetical protein